MQFFIGPFLTWLPMVAFWAFAAGITLIHFFHNREDERDTRNIIRAYRKLLFAACAFRILYAILLTIGQYILWANNALSKIFLGSPLMAPKDIQLVPAWLSWLFNGDKGYFIFYALSRFWLSALLSIGIAFIWFLFLKSLERHRERFFDTGEVALGLLAALVVGWPTVVVFVPLVFVFVVVMSMVRMLVWGHRYTTLGTPFVLAMLVALLIGPTLISTTWLSVLKI